MDEDCKNSFYLTDPFFHFVYRKFFFKISVDCLQVYEYTTYHPFILKL
jgi:hypothetical protein